MYAICLICVGTITGVFVKFVFYETFFNSQSSTKVYALSLLLAFFNLYIAQIMFLNLKSRLQGNRGTKR